MLDGILLGLATAFSLHNMAFIILGCIVGTFIGLLPGLGPMTAIALMIPIAAALDPSAGIMMMAAVYYGAIFGGSSSSILINAPGVASTVATSFDGYPMTQQGKAGRALTIAALASFAGGIIAAAFLLISAPWLAELSLMFQSADYFALLVLGLVSVSAFAGQGGMLKSLLMCVVGLMLSTVGTDQNQGLPRFTLGYVDLIDGISFLALVMATFALSEALMGILKLSPQQQTSRAQKTQLAVQIERSDVTDATPPVVRSSLLGFIIGLLPGAGATIASFLAYSMERQLASPLAQKKFGNGSIEGLAAPEAANNAAATGSFVPLLTLGIPGSGTTAIILGALIAYGVQPGPMLYLNEPEIFWSVIVSMWIGNAVLLAINLPLIPYITRILSIPQHYLLPTILFLSITGVYLVSFNTFDIYLMVVFAVCAVCLRLLQYPMAPMLLGFILGGMIEENLARALLIYDNSWAFLWQRPLTFIILSISVTILFAPTLKALRQKFFPG